MARLTVGKTGSPRCSPSFFGVTPPTMFVPHSIDSFAFAVACRPVKPWNITRVCEPIRRFPIVSSYPLRLGEYEKDRLEMYFNFIRPETGLGQQLLNMVRMKERFQSQKNLDVVHASLDINKVGVYTKDEMGVNFRKLWRNMVLK
jgi:hypothetical protein